MAKKLVSLGQFLKASRQSAGLSQKAVATKFGYTTPQFISNWERGVSFPPVNILKRLAEFYKVNPDDLFEILLQTRIEEVKADFTKTFYKKAKG